MLLTNVVERLQAYERDGMHYHLAATGIYAARAEIGDVLSVAYHPYIIAGLIAYDMARQLGAKASPSPHIDLATHFCFADSDLATIERKNPAT
jgi:hypothetical protein